MRVVHRLRAWSVVLLVAAALALAGRLVRSAPIYPLLCDASADDCRADVLGLIAAETKGIDVSFWFMDDARYSAAIVKRWNAGVPVRVIMDPRANASKPVNATILSQLQSAGIPMRTKSSGDIAHWKGMIFAGQSVAEFSGANYSPYEYVPQTPYLDYNDEAIYFSNEPDVVQSLMERFDDIWTSTNGYADYANVVDPPVRSYPTYTIAPEFNFPPDDSYFNRLHPLLQAETQQIDATMYRITDSREADDLIAAVQKGVTVRLYAEPSEYRNPARLDDSYNIDRMYVGGVAIRMRAHAGLNHQKTVLLYAQGTTVFGTSNWSTASDDNQLEVNYFTTKGWFFEFFHDLFERKWNNAHVMPDGTSAIETQPFAPLPPDKPAYAQPANGSAAIDPTQPATVQWKAGSWARQYDVYLGTTSPPPLLKANVNLGPSQSSTDLKSFVLPALQPGTKYYWQIVSKTMANLTASGPVWSFTTTGTAATTCQDPAATNVGGPLPCVYAAPPSLPAPWTNEDIGAVGLAGSTSVSGGTFTVTGAGADVWNSADAFQFAYQPLDGDGEIVARVASVPAANTWSKAGVMIRATTAADSAYAFMLVSAAKGAAFQYRTAAGVAALGTTIAGITAPSWVKLTRSGSVVSAFQSSDGSAWQPTGTATIAMGASVSVGLAVTSHDRTKLCAATFDHVVVTANGSGPTLPATPSGPAPADGATNVAATPTLAWTSAGATSYDVNFGTTNPPTQIISGQTAATYATATLSSSTKYFWQIVAHNAAGATAGPVWSFTTAASPLPAPWLDQDIGSVGAAGSASASGGTFAVTGAGADIWNAADAFHYVYQPLAGDGQVVARVASVQNVAAWTKAGVMIRDAITPSSAYALMLVSAGKGTAFQYRTAGGASAQSVTGPAATAPAWVKITRAGSVVSAYESADGAAWTLVGSATIALSVSAEVGLAVSSHTTAKAATATFDNVSVSPSGSGSPFAGIHTAFVVLMENHDWADIKGNAAAPYLNSLLAQGASAGQYYNPPSVHPSLPNYLWLEAGQRFGIADDNPPSAHHQSTTAHLVTQLEAAGLSWKAYEEGIDGTSCPLADAGLYTARHDPFVYFDDVTNTNDPAAARCIAHVRPYTELANDLQQNTVANYNFITPNLCDDMHDCDVAAGDTWLSTELPKILNAAAYQHAVVFVTWDEGEGNDGPIGLIALSPFARAGYSNAIRYTHSSTLRTLQEIFGLTNLLGDAANATDLSDLFVSSAPSPSQRH